MLLAGHEGRWDYKECRIKFSNVYTFAKYLLSAGRVSLILDELDEFEAGVEEAVDAVGEARLFGARETGRGRSGHTLVPTHASHLVDRFLNTGLRLLLLYELREFLLCRVVELVHWHFDV